MPKSVDKITTEDKPATYFKNGKLYSLHQETSEKAMLTDIARNEQKIKNNTKTQENIDATDPEKSAYFKKLTDFANADLLKQNTETQKALLDYSMSKKLKK